MASFAPNKIDLSQIHNGQRYQNGDIVSPEAINAPIEASSWAQQIAEEAVVKADQALNYGIGNAQGTFPALTAYPIGAFFITINSANPAELFGGFWLRIKDAFLWASGDTASITYTENGVSVTKSLSVKSRGGEATHTLTVYEIPSHTHEVRHIARPIIEGGAVWGSLEGSDTVGATIYWGGAETTSAGGNKAHNNMPPYYAVNAWVRVTEEEFNANESL